MFFKKKENQFKFNCIACGKCCSYFSINLTSFDIWRIEKYSDLKPGDFVNFSPTEAHDSEGFISRYSKTSMVMKTKTNGKDCMFLSEDNFCTIHEYKPLVCRVWPFEFVNKDIRWIREHVYFIKKYCDLNTDKELDKDEISHYLEQYNDERAKYIKIVEIWNKAKLKTKDGTDCFYDASNEEYLEFLDKYKVDIYSDVKIREDLANVINNGRKDTTGWYRRFRQFTKAIFASIKNEDILFLNKYLDNQMLEIFLKMDVIDQRHCIDVAYTLRDKYKDITDDLIRAALLHDIGKQLKDISITDRILYVLSPKDKLNNDKLNTIKYHDEYGAKLAQEKGLNDNIAEIIRLHHQKPPLNKDIEMLQWADELN